MPIRNEQIREAAADIKRRAIIIVLMRRALNPAPIPDDPREPLPRQKKPRAVLIIPARHAQRLRACMCLRARYFAGTASS
jgi:hypothetical protein